MVKMLIYRCVSRVRIITKPGKLAACISLLYKARRKGGPHRLMKK